MQIPRIRLSDKISRLHPRHVVPKPAQAYELEVPVKVREWIGPAPASPDLVLEAQPPAQPHRGVVVDRPIRFGDGAYLEVVRPSLTTPWGLPCCVRFPFVHAVGTTRHSNWRPCFAQ